jgi:hypothetical protein
MVTRVVSKTWQRWSILVVGALLGVLFFAQYEGMRTVDPRECGWMLNGKDGRWMQIGWEFFRRQPWASPPGRITQMDYPLGTAIANTDSIPLLGIVLKPLSALLPEPFQYFGAWQLLCAVLQGVFAALLMRLSGAPWPYQVLGTALFLWNPIAMPSGEHPARAAAGWMILAGFWLYFRPVQSTSRRRELAAWLVLAALGAGINPYVCVMALAIGIAFFVRRWRVDRALTFTQAGLGLASVLLTAVVMWWIAGYFTVGSYHGLIAGELGYWSMNLLAPVNPMGWSRYLPDQPTATAGQYEGPGYMGLGVLVLALTAGVSLLIHPPTRAAIAQALLPALACAILVVGALSPKVTLGADVVVELPRVLYAPLAPFRASGRFFQPAAYLMLFLALRAVAHRLRPWHATALILAVVAIQYADLHDKLDEFRRRNTDESRYAWAQPLHWDAWRFATDTYARMILVPAEGWDPEVTVPLVYLAARSGMAINSGEAARGDIQALWNYRRAEERRMSSGVLDPAELYIVHPEHLDEFKSRHGDRVTCLDVDGYHACSLR